MKLIPLKYWLVFVLVAGAAVLTPKLGWPTVTNTTVSTTTGYGTGAQVNFAITFDFRDNSEIGVAMHDTSTNPVTITTIAQGGASNQFTVTGGNPGTTVTMGTAPSLTQFLVITRTIPLTQPVVFSAAGVFPYQGISNQLDLMTLQMQNLNAGIGGSPGVGPSGTPVGQPSPLANNFWGWDASGSVPIDIPGNQSTFNADDVIAWNGTSWGVQNMSPLSIMGYVNDNAGSYAVSPGAGGTGAANTGIMAWNHAIVWNTSAYSNLTLPTSGTLIAGTLSTGNSPNTIPIRDSSGNFAAGTITANVTGNVTGNLTGNVTGNTSGTAANVTGVVAIGNGGTGQTTQPAALTALTGTQTANKVAMSDGTNTYLQNLPAAALPTVPWSKMAQQTANTILITDGSGNESVLPAGSNGMILQSNGTTAQWANVVSTTAVNLQGGAAGSVPYQTGSSATTFLPVGTTGQVMAVASGVPTWTTNIGANTTGNAATATTATTATSFSGSLLGDVTGTQGATSVVKVNGAAVPTSKTIVGTNSSGQIIDATASALSNNTSGTAANITASSNSTLTSLPNLPLSGTGLGAGVNSGDFIGWNGSNWVEVTQSTAAGQPVTLFYDNTASGISTYKTLQATTSAASQQDESVAVTTGTSPVTIDTFISNESFGTTTIPGGDWGFDSYGYVSAGATCHFQYVVKARTAGGSETTLFTATGPTMSGATTQLYSSDGFQQAFAVNATDKLVVVVQAVNSSATSRTVHFVYAGTTNASHMHTPLTLQHNDLAGLQGGSSGQYYHLTSSQYTLATQNASGSQTGLLSSTDWTTFNGKQASGNYITSLTSDVTASGAGAAAATIAANAVTNAKAAQMAAHTIKGNNTGSTANSLDLTDAQVAAELPAFVGDSGSGGTKGSVPAPASGDAAASKFLKADGTWAAPGGAGTVTSVTFTGDGTVLSSTPSTAVTSSGTVTAALKTQTAGTFLAGPTSGSAAAPTFRALQSPTIQKFTSGSGTYTTATGSLYIRVRMVGGGGGGGGTGSGATNGQAGGNTTFGSSLLVANGGGLGNNSGGAGGSGGTASLGSGPIGLAITGGGGQSAGPAVLGSFGGNGGSSALGGAGTNTGPGASNSGSGGAGGNGNASYYASAGGGSGGFVDAIITSPSATYSYSVGGSGANGTGGLQNGGSGGSGLIEVTEYYQ